MFDLYLRSIVKRFKAARHTLITMCDGCAYELEEKKDDPRYPADFQYSVLRDYRHRIKDAWRKLNGTY